MYRAGIIALALLMLSTAALAAPSSLPGGKSALSDVPTDVPTDGAPAAAVRSLQRAGIVTGYPDGTYGGPRSMSRYELALAVSRLLPWLSGQLAQARQSDSPEGSFISASALTGLLQKYVTPETLNNFLKAYPAGGDFYSRTDTDRLFAQHRELAAMLALLNELRDELAAYGVDTDVLNRERRAVESGLAHVDKISVSGSATTVFKASAQYDGTARGQVNPGVDKDGALLDNGSPLNPRTPAYRGAMAQGKRGLFSDPSVLYDTQLGMRYNPSRDVAVVAQFILGSYWGAWQEGQAFSAGYSDSGVGLLSNRQSASASLQPYLAYLALPLGSDRKPGGRSGAAIGRVPTRLTRLTWWAVDPDTYVSIPREDSGDIALTGARLTAKFAGGSLSLFGGYDPTDGTVPWTTAALEDRTENGRIGFGHPVRPGGGQVPGLGLLYGSLNRSHLLVAAAGAAPTGLYYDVPSLSSVAGARVESHGIGVNYVIGAGDDWRRSLQQTDSGALIPVFDRTGQVWSVDWSTRSGGEDSPQHGVSFQGEVAASQSNNWGASGVQSEGAFQIQGQPGAVRSTQGNATQYHLTIPLGLARWYLGARSISPGFEAPGYWGSLGSWVNPWNIVSDSPIYLRAGRGAQRWEVPLLPSEIGLGVPVENVPFIGRMALNLQAGVAHMQTTVDGSYVTPVAPSSGMAEVTDPQHFKITHASAGLSFGAGPRSGYQFGLQAEDVLRDYPASGGVREDATFLWSAIKNLLNVSGGAGARQPHLLDTLPAGADGPIQSDENYYRLSVARALSASGSAVARLTLSQVVYTDRSGANPAAPGGGSYRGAVGTMQLTFKF